MPRTVVSILIVAAFPLLLHAEGTVSWTVQDAQGPGPMYYTAGDTVNWKAWVDVTDDDNAGLATYLFTISIVDASNAPIANTPTSDFAKSFNALGNAGSNASKAIQDSSIGGLTMNCPYSAGTAGPGLSAGIGTCYGTAWTGSSPTGSGIMFAGVGHADRKVTYSSNPSKGLLADGVSEFVMNDGTIPTTGLAPGLYTVKLIPDASAHNVLAPAFDPYGNFDPPPYLEAVVVNGSSFVFGVVPEPGTLLLIAGGLAVGCRCGRTTNR